MLLARIAGQLAPLVPAGTEVLAGLEMGGIPIATALSLHTGLPAAFVRKEAKSTARPGSPRVPTRRPAGDCRRGRHHHRRPGGHQRQRPARRSARIVEHVVCVIDRSPDAGAALPPKA